MTQSNRVDTMTKHELKKAEFQGELAARWKCKSKNCPSQVCFVLEDHNDIHVPLKAREYAVWCEAWVSSLVYVLCWLRTDGTCHSS
jgi:hypothetical protein